MHAFQPRSKSKQSIKGAVNSHRMLIKQHINQASAGAQEVSTILMLAESLLIEANLCLKIVIETRVSFSCTFSNLGMPFS